MRIQRFALFQKIHIESHHPALGFSDRVGFEFDGHVGGLNGCRWHRDWLTALQRIVGNGELVKSPRSNEAKPTEERQRNIRLVIVKARSGEASNSQRLGRPCSYCGQLLNCPYQSKAVAPFTVTNLRGVPFRGQLKVTRPRSLFLPFSRGLSHVILCGRKA